MQTKSDKLEAKRRYWKKIYDAAPVIPCACGCGELIKSKDKYGRDKKYISGHNGRKYADPKEYQRQWYRRHKDEVRSRKPAQRKRYSNSRKEELLLLRGGKCVQCGYTYDGTNAPALDFHHRDPSTKKYALSGQGAIDISREKALIEAEKCDILCAICHRLHHFS